jgi:hypothetical protein
VRIDWQETTLAAAGTHHLHQGLPFYEPRFLEVLSFHAPGIAAVRDSSGAFHVGLDGAPLYPQRYQRTFGFYEGRATVMASDGAHPIGGSGGAVSAERFAWCGNFQAGRCTVRGFDGRYFHLTRAGVAAYPDRWRYAGDFRESAAVVQADSGLHHHIDPDGKPRGAGEYLDLDVFHKGFARARDSDGWFHLRSDGAPAYRRRFSAIEPFYNGQARCESHDGALVVIDEEGRDVLALRPPLRSSFASLSGDLVGFWRTQTLAAAVELGIPDSLPGSVESVAEATGLPTASLHRLLHALGELGAVERDGDDLWRLSAKGEPLHSGHPRSLAHAALEYAGIMGDRWRRLPEALRQGAAWRPPDFFDEVAGAPELRVAHHRTLASYADHDYRPLAAAVELDGVERLVDAGGGHGVLLQMLLERAPDLRGVLLDRPEVVREARFPEGMDQRIELRAGTFFAPWDFGRCDAVVLARVLHDWPDPEALQLLRRARESVGPGGRLFVAEMVLDERAHAGALCDLHLLAVTGGRERTRREFDVLLAAGGFRLRQVKPLPSVVSLLVAEAA